MGFETRQLSDGLFLIDAGMHGEPERLACYLFDGPERVLIECGPSVSLHHLVDGLEALGIDDLATIVVTHIHLDHAGGAGQLARRFPRARIGVHRLGAQHLIDPSRLWESASRIYGDEGMKALWGPMESISEDRLLILDEGGAIPLGAGRWLQVLYTPGHAKHHVVFYEDDSGGCFVGDAVGIAFPHGHFVQPVTPPPDLDPGLVVEQLHRIDALDPSFLGFAHYGPDENPSKALAEGEERLIEWVDKVESLPDDDSAVDLFREWVLDRYRAKGISEHVIAVYDRNTYWPMQLAGIRRWLSQRA